ATAQSSHSRLDPHSREHRNADASRSVGRTMRIDVWSDIACPWCYIGKRRLESALASFPHADRVEVVWHSFQLDPTAPVPPVETSTSALARKYGGGPEQIAAMQDRVSSLAAAEGLDYQLERTLHLNTRDAHR